MASLEQDFEALLTCPLTQCLFENPVVAADGHVYEREAFNEYCRKNTFDGFVKSPITKETISTQAYPCYTFNSMRDLYFRLSPKAKEEWEPVYASVESSKILLKKFENGDYGILDSLMEIDPKYILQVTKTFDFTINFFRNSSSVLIKKFFNLIKNFTIKDANGATIVGHIIKISSAEIFASVIEYLTAKNIMINPQTNLAPIHALAFVPDDPSYVREILKISSIKFAPKCNKGWTVLHYLCQNCHHEKLSAALGCSGGLSRRIDVDLRIFSALRVVAIDAEQYECLTILDIYGSRASFAKPSRLATIHMPDNTANGAVDHMVVYNYYTAREILFRVAYKHNYPESKLLVQVNGIRISGRDVITEYCRSWITGENITETDRKIVITIARLSDES
jgi:hypothetical protein